MNRSPGSCLGSFFCFAIFEFNKNISLKFKNRR